MVPNMSVDLPQGNVTDVDAVTVSHKIAEISTMGITCIKNATNPYFDSKYADLATVEEALKEPLKNIKLQYRFYLSNRDGGSKITTAQNGTVTTETQTERWYVGLWVNDPESKTGVGYEFPLVNVSTAQEIGKGITYAKRYLLTTIFNVIAEEDDDGNSVSGVQNTKVPKRQPKPLSSNDINKQVNDEIPNFF